MKTWILSGLTLAALAAPGFARADGSAITGTVRWAGPARTAPPLKVTQDPQVCGAAKPDEALLVDKSGGVQNVVVSLVGVAGATRPPPTNLRLGQKTCQFVPHVQAVPAGSTLVIGNGDTVLHNVHGYREGATLFNLALPIPNMEIKRKLSVAGLNSFRCDAGHVWMSAYIWTFDHPYFALTDTAGHFSIANVPPGSYTLRAWHEGWKRKDPTSIVTTPIVVEQQVKVEAGKPTQVGIELK